MNQQQKIFPRTIAQRIVAGLVPLGLLLPTVPARAVGLLNEWVVGTAPYAEAVNPVTNKVYVSNTGDGSVSVLDPVSGSMVSVKVGSIPRGIAVNPTTNKIYVANYGDNSVSVVDGTNNAVTRLAVGIRPYVVAVNDVTNKITSSTSAVIV